MAESTKFPPVLKRKAFNLSLLNLNQEALYKQLGEVTSTQMFDGSNYNLHPEGLWSNELFGAIGTPERLNKQGWINLNVTVLHPVVYKELIAASKLLEEIMSGETFAIFNPETKFFDRSNAIDGQTGFEFFMSHVDEMKMPDTGSPKRRELIKLLEKNKETYKIDKIVVLQAAYRDVEFKDGQITHDEVNQIYREILNYTTSLSSNSHKRNLSLIDSTRYAIQKTLLKLYLYLGEITGHGKKKLVQNKWASRTVFNATRNVITAPTPSGRFAEAPTNVGYKDTIVGLFQQLVSCLPFSIRGIKESFLKEKFLNPLEPVVLANKKTLKREEVYLNQEWFDLFQSDEGIKKLIQKYRPEEVRHRYMEVDGRYLALIYKGKDGGFKIINSIEELPADRDKEDVYPITFTELLYICTCHLIDKKPCITTRYPITGIESNVIANCKLKTTERSEVRYQLDDNWQKDELVEPFYQFPLYGVTTVNSSSPPTASLAGLGGDFDGDVLSNIVLFTEESLAEVEKYNREKRAYVGPDGNLRYPVEYDTISFVCYNLCTFEEEPSN